jgi:hypothetical protein
MTTVMAGVERIIRCSFCNKTQLEVRKVVAGANAFICNECLEIVHEIMQQEQETPAVPMWPAPEPEAEGRSTVVTCKVCALRSGWTRHWSSGAAASCVLGAVARSKHHWLNDETRRHE